MKKIILTLLTITLLFTPYMNIYAAENISIEGSHNIQVYADVTSTFEITLPSVIKSTESGIKEVSFHNKGKISSTEYLEITIPKNVTLTSDTKEDIIANLTLSQNLFNSNELSGEGTDAVLSIDASKLQSGEYEGAFDVNVRLTKYNYQLPEGLDFKPYIIVYRNSETNAEIIATTDCKLEYNPGYNCVGYYEQSPVQNVTSYAKLPGSDTWTKSSGTLGPQLIQMSYEILYCNYDIINRETGEIWK